MNDNDISRILKGSYNREVLYKSTQSKNTQIAYDKGWQAFSTWCSTYGLDPLEISVDDVVRFLVTKVADQSEINSNPLSLNTVRLYRTAINDRFRQFGKVSPASDQLVSDVLRGLAKLKGDVPRRVKALREHQLIAMLESCSIGLHGLRDAAMLSIGFAAALRRSELCSLCMEDIKFKGDEGILLLIRHSKTDLFGTGQQIAIPKGQQIKPILHLKNWLQASGISRGFLFQTLERGGVPTGRNLDPGDVARVVKRYVKRIGLNPSEYSGHSLRAGFVTSAAVYRARIEKIMEVTRHRSTDTLMKYIREEELFVEHAGHHFL